ncbi:MAG: rhombosortase [Pseudomonadota bacterium]
MPSLTNRVHFILGLAVLSGVIMGLAWAGDAARAAFHYDPALVSAGAIWRLVMAHLVHLTTAHAGMNVLGVLFVAAVLWEVINLRRYLIVSLWSALAISVGFWMFDPEVQSYVGWSGVTHGLFAWGGLVMLGHRAWFGVVILACLGTKIWWEQTAGPTPGASDAIGGVILLDSHLYGVFGGIFAFIAGYVSARAHWFVVTVLLGAVALPEATDAHGRHDRLAVLEIPKDGTLELRILFDIVPFALRAPETFLTEETRQRVDGLTDADLQDYVDGASAYLLWKVAFEGRDGTQANARRIRMPKASALRAHVAESDTFAPSDTMSAAEIELSTVILLFDAEAVCALDGPSLSLPPLLGQLELVTVDRDGNELREPLFPGLASRPLPICAQQ